MFLKFKTAGHATPRDILVSPAQIATAEPRDTTPASIRLMLAGGGLCDVLSTMAELEAALEGATIQSQFVALYAAAAGSAWADTPESHAKLALSHALALIDAATRAEGEAAAADALRHAAPTLRDALADLVACHGEDNLALAAASGRLAICVGAARDALRLAAGETEAAASDGDEGGE